MEEEDIPLSNDDFYVTVKVKELQPEDYYLGSKTPTMLRDGSCCMILFYLPQDQTSQDLKQLWANLAASLAAPNFYAVNGAKQSAILQAYKQTGADPDHPLYPFRVDGFPTILVYRKHWPQAYYNGDLSYDAMLNYSITLACKPGYYEPENDYLGVAGIEEEEVVDEPRIANISPPVSSREFTSGEPYLEQIEEAEPEYPLQEQPELVEYQPLET